MTIGQFCPILQTTAIVPNATLLTATVALVGVLLPLVEAMAGAGGPSLKKKEKRRPYLEQPLIR